MNFIRIPIGQSEEDRDNFIVNVIECKLGEDEEKVEKLWNMYASRSVLQLVVDVENNYVVGTMESNQFGQTLWQFSSEFLNKIPNIVEYNDNDNDEVVAKPKGKKLSKKIEFKVDDILDEMTELGGFEKLSKEKQDFLNNQ